MSWRPYEPQLPEFRYRPRDTPYQERGYDVYVNGNFIGAIYGSGIFRLGLNSTKYYTLEEVSEKLWDRFRNA